jgi:hypothetical protein
VAKFLTEMEWQTLVRSRKPAVEKPSPLDGDSDTLESAEQRLNEWLAGLDLSIVRRVDFVHECKYILPAKSLAVEDKILDLLVEKEAPRFSLVKSKEKLALPHKEGEKPWPDEFQSTQETLVIIRTAYARSPRENWWFRYLYYSLIFLTIAFIALIFVQIFYLINL